MMLNNLGPIKRYLFQFQNHFIFTLVTCLIIRLQVILFTSCLLNIHLLFVYFFIMAIFIRIFVYYLNFRFNFVWEFTCSGIQYVWSSLIVL